MHVRSWWAHQERQCSCFYCGSPPQQWAYCLMRAPLGHGERPRAFVIIVITVSGNQGPTCHLSSPPHCHHCRGDLQDTCTSMLLCSASVCVCVGEVCEQFVVATTASVNLYELSKWQLHAHTYTHPVLISSFFMSYSTICVTSISICSNGLTGSRIYL